MSRPVFVRLFCLFLLASSGCMISEQEGQDREDLTFQFDTEFNRIILFTRSGALAVVALWLFAGSKKNPGTKIRVSSSFQGGAAAP